MRPVPSQKRARKVNHNLGVTLRYKSRLPLGPGSDREAVSYSLSRNVRFGDDASTWPRQPASPPPCATTPADPAGPYGRSRSANRLCRGPELVADPLLRLLSVYLHGGNGG
jgi:hypothetical protein